MKKLKLNKLKIYFLLFQIRVWQVNQDNQEVVQLFNRKGVSMHREQLEMISQQQCLDIH